jgi:hypothetical protein
MQVASGVVFRAYWAVARVPGRHSCRLALLVACLTCSALSAAQPAGEPPPPPPAPAPAPQVAAVWYRSGEGCPDGAAFIDRLRLRSIPAQLAQVGDRIDFVVTLGSGPDGGRGRLERQAEQGTVALREVQGKTCEGVADALALSLALTWDPHAERPPIEPPLHSEALPVAVEPPAAVPMSETPASTVPPAPAPAPSARIFWLGVDTSLWTLSERTPFFGGALFGELRSARAGTGFRPLVRLSAELAFSPDLRDDVQGWIGAARIEACPVSVGSKLVQLRPCTGFDLGVLRAVGSGPSGESSNGFWAAWSSHARVSWEPETTWGLDAQVGIIVPLTRYELTVGPPDQSIAELRNWAISVGIGAHWSPP